MENQLTFIEDAGRDKHNALIAKYQCSCGQVITTRKQRVLSNQTKSCGHLRGLNMTNAPITENSAEYHLRYNYIRDANRRNLDFELTNEEAGQLFRSNCFYCGVAPFRIKRLSKSRSTFVYNGIDRRDTSKGYTKANSVPCCSHCNYAKHAMSESEFFEWIKRVVRFQKF
jgi:hypothetical protein